MPGFDGTGPRGMGSRTGGGFGRCAAPAGEELRQGYGGGGRGRGMGRRMRSCRTFFADVPEEIQLNTNISVKNETEELKSRITSIENSLSDIKSMLSDRQNDNSIRQQEESAG
jgi:hypothetical protein